MILNPGDIAVDYIAKKNPASLVAAGVRLVVRYDSPNPANPKNLTVAEADGLLAAGLGLLVVFESSAVDPLKGAAVGAQHGALHEAHLNDIYRYPGDIVSIVAVDFDTQLVQVETILDYVRAFNDHTSRPLWVYGEADLVDVAVLRGVAVGGWQTVAWSHKRVSDHAFCLQHATPVHPSVPPLGSIDDNTVLRSFRAWSLAPDPQPVPQPLPGGDDMQIRLMVLRDSDAQFLAEMTNDGRALFIWWADGSTKSQAAVAAHRSAALATNPVTGRPNQAEFELKDQTIAGLINCRLIGRLPFGDSKHTWTGDEVLDWDRPATSTDQAARDGVALVSADLADLDASVEKIKHGLVASGT